MLTATSTFGTCIAGLGEIGESYYVKPDGSFHRRATVDPIDAGTLDHQKPQITSVLQLPPSFAKPRLAFVYLMMRLSDKDILLRSIESLHRHFNEQHHYSIVIFVQNPEEWRFIHFITSVRVHVVRVDPVQWAVPSNVTDYPDIFRLRSLPSHSGFNVQYRQMSRYAAGFLFGHLFLARFEYVVKMDADVFAYAAWADDPLMRMHTRNARIGFWISYADIDDVVDGLWACFARYVVTNKLKLRQPGLLLDAEGRYRNTNLYGCFMGARTAEFRSAEYMQLFRHFDATGGFFRHRWDEQKLFAFYVAVFMEADEVEYFSYISIEHQEWARNAQRLKVETLSDDIVQRALSYN